MIAACVASVATSEGEPLPPQSVPSPAYVEYDAVALSSVATSGQGFSGAAGTGIELHTTGQPGADGAESAVQLEIFPSGGAWPADVVLNVSDTRTSRTWQVTAAAGSGPVFLEIEDAYENCWGQGFVPSCESGFEAVLTGPAGTEVEWDARLVGDSALGGYQPRLVGLVD
ncbi:MAG: hypothetical protein H6737_15840 [Alphaproteobacteria bacterium]|nr:hypothetical protein [Alphaproteobacteria bacterium]